MGVSKQFRGVICLSLVLFSMEIAMAETPAFHGSGAVSGGHRAGSPVAQTGRNTELPVKLGCDIAGATEMAAKAIGKAREMGALCGRKIRSLHPSLASGIDEKRKEEAFSQCLSSYVQQESVNPPGHEELSAAFLDSVFSTLGIPTRCFWAPGVSNGAPKRINIVASLTPTNAAKGIAGSEPFRWDSERGKCDAPKDPSLLLINHLDVVEVHPQQWKNPDYALGGQIAADPQTPNGPKYIWGRGSLDMKGIAMLQLFSMALIKLKRSPIEKVIHFLGVADEEQDSTGALGAVEQMRCGGKLEALMNAKVGLNEGGFGIGNAMGKGSIAHVIGTEEKGGAWLKLKSQDPYTVLHSLEKLGLIPRAGEGYVDEAKQWGCRLAKFTTDKPKVNVVASDVTLTLACKSPPDKALLEKVFGNRLAGNVTVNVSGRQASIRLETKSSSHGSMSLNASALEATVLGLQRIHAYHPTGKDNSGFFRYQATPASIEFLNRLGETHQFSMAPHLSHVGDLLSLLGPNRALGPVGAQLSSERLFRTSCSWSAFQVAPEGTEAMLDCRLLSSAIGFSGLKSKDEGEEFRLLMDDYLNNGYRNKLLGMLKNVPRTEITTIGSWNFNQSPRNHPAVKIIESELRRKWPESLISPWLFPAGTDSHLFRERGIPTYGFFPIVIPSEDVGTQHGSNERFPISQILPGTEVYERVLMRVAQ